MFIYIYIYSWQKHECITAKRVMFEICVFVFEDILSTWPHLLFSIYLNTSDFQLPFGSLLNIWTNSWKRKTYSNLSSQIHWIFYLSCIYTHTHTQIYVCRHCWLPDIRRANLCIIISGTNVKEKRNCEFKIYQVSYVYIVRKRECAGFHFLTCKTTCNG